MSNQPPVTPERIFQTLTAYQHSAALKAGIELDIFSKIGEGNTSPFEIAKTCQASERGVRILCDGLTIMGFLTKENNKYGLTEESALFLDRNSPAYFGDTAFFMMSDKLMEGFNDLANAVRKGGTTVGKEGSLDPENPIWVKFARSMMGMMMPVSHMIADKLGFEENKELKVLDIAAGHGLFGIAIAQKHPNAQIYALDWANVLEVAKENSENMGVNDRYHLLNGSAFEVDFGENYDVVLLTNFLHHFDKRTNEELLQKIRNSLKPDGKVLTLEFVPNEDRISPPSQAMFSLSMLTSTPAGDAYTFEDLRMMFENSGFSKNELIPLDPMPQQLLISMK